MQFNTGTFLKGHIPWNKGLTKEDDERIAQYGRKQSETKRKSCGIITRNELYELYWEHSLSITKIAKRINRSDGYVYAKMKEFGIPIRSKKEASKRYRRREKCVCTICNKTFYIIKSHYDNGQGVTCSRKCHFEYLKTLPPWNKGKKWSDEVKQKLSENHADFSMEKHPNWQGGISFEPYSSEFNEALKEKIRKRDNRQCQECGYKEDKSEHNLAVHHIDYDKKNNTPSNLISLCPSCHSKTNYYRSDWLIHFQKKMEESRNAVQE